MTIIAIQKSRSQSPPRWKSIASGHYQEILILLIIVYVELFGGWNSLAWVTLIKHTIPIFLVALASTFVMLTGRIDLSITSMSAAAAAVLVVLSDIVHPLIALFITFVAAFLLWFAIGAVISYLRANSLGFTLGLMLVVQYGLHWARGGYEPIDGPHLSTHFAIGADWRIQALVVLLTSVLTGTLLYCTRIGLWLRAVGSASDVFEALGGRRHTVSGLAYGLCGLVGVVAAVIAAARVERATLAPDNDLLLWGIAAAIIGGVSLDGGRGTLWMPIRGSLLFGLIKESLDIAGLPSDPRMTALGLLTLIAVGFSEFLRRRFLNETKIL